MVRSRGKKKVKQQKSHSPDSSSSREPSPKFGEGRYLAQHRTNMKHDSFYSSSFDDY